MHAHHPQSFVFDYAIHARDTLAKRVSTTTKCAGRTHTTIARRATQERKEKERGDIFLID